jgi:peptidyl-prolyl cis-trans isomerase-like protein 2
VYKLALSEIKERALVLSKRAKWPKKAIDTTRRRDPNLCAKANRAVCPLVHCSLLPLSDIAIMVKRQKEKQYQSAREHRANQGLRAGTASSANSRVQRRLPFDCCALTLTPYETPVCTSQGIIFENSALLRFLLKHKVDPVTGETMTTRDVITLNMDKDEEGRWQCPVLTKPFSDQTKIVAIRQPGTNQANVYSHEAYQELNVKAKNYQDLTSGSKFTKNDVILLNDPLDEAHSQLRDINNFHHIRHARSLESSAARTDNVKYSVTATRIMDQLKRQKQEAPTESELPSQKRMKIFSNAVTGVQMTSGRVSGSLTSTYMDVIHDGDAKEATEEEILLAQFAVMRRRKKKGYVTLHTTMGDIGLELHCDIAPRTCTNFLGLAEAGHYNNTKFHRLISNFMIQGGKSETNDSSLWGEAFVDEFDDRLTHTGEGIVAMANAGPNTNKRQFYLTFKSCNHLDRKHSVFGRVIQGLDVLQAINKVPVDKKERPTTEIKILRVEVLKNPAKEAEEAERIRIEEASDAKRRQDEAKKTSALGRNTQSARPKGFMPHERSAADGPAPVGKYLSVPSVHKKSKINASKDDDDDTTLKSTVPTRLPPPPKKTSFNDFSGW